jgi:hypothetical protein
MTWRRKPSAWAKPCNSAHPGRQRRGSVHRKDSFGYEFRDTMPSFLQVDSRSVTLRDESAPALILH